MKTILYFLVSVVFLSCGKSANLNDIKIQELEAKNKELMRQVRVLDSSLMRKKYPQADFIYEANVAVSNPKLIHLGDTLKSEVRFILPEPIYPTTIHIDGLEGLYKKQLKNDLVYEVSYVPKIKGKLKYKGDLYLEVCEGTKRYPFEIVTVVQ